MRLSNFTVGMIIVLGKIVASCYFMYKFEI